MFLLSTIWASRFPPHVQAILAGQTEGSLDSASQLADRNCEVTPLPTTASNSPSTPDNTAGLLERIQELSRQVASLRASQTHSRPHSRVRHRSHSRDRRSSTPDNSAAPPHLLVPLAVRRLSPKMLPTVLPTVNGLSPTERLPPTERIPPGGKLHRRTTSALPAPAASSLWTATRNSDT